MSLGLVSYDSSSEGTDDEESSESNIEVQSQSSNRDIATSSSSSNTISATPRNHGQKVINQDSNASKDTLKSKISSSSKLTSSVSNDEDGDYSTSKSKLGLPPPKRRGTAIKIPVPALPEPDSDDDEEEEPQPKKAKPGKKISSLFAMLPEPKHATLKQTNRLLIPHTLTKKPAPPVVKRPPPPSALPRVSTSNSGNDRPSEEVEEGNFFSLDSSASKSKSLPSSSGVLESDSKSTSVPRTIPKSDSIYEKYRATASEQDIEGNLPESSNMKNVASRDGNDHGMKGNKFKFQGRTFKSQSKLSSKLVTSTSDVQSETSREAGIVPKKMASKLVTQSKPEFNEQPLDFNNQKTPHGYQLLSSGGASSHHHSVGGMPSVQYGSAYSHNQEGSYPHQSTDSYIYPSTSEGDAASYHGNLKDTSLIHDKAFQKMVGKGNFDPSAMNIIDVNADDHISSVNAEDWMLKSLTEEKEAREELKKEQLPTHQQKRKHQITYLARQARERELELKNSWAQNRMTRKQTQAKYGF